MSRFLLWVLYALVAAYIVGIVAVWIFVPDANGSHC